MGRSERHLKIIDLISKSDIDTQEELVTRLKDGGHNVTQATVSRDIKDLGLIKVMTEDRRYKYSYVKDNEPKSSVINLFKETVISMKAAQNLIVIKCISAGAGASAAMIDKLNLSEIVGTVAGDDTVLVVVNSSASVKNVLSRLKQLTY